MAIPTYEELLRERYDQKVAQAKSLVSEIAAQGHSQYDALDAILPEIAELAEHLKVQPVSFAEVATSIDMRKRILGKIS